MTNKILVNIMENTELWWGSVMWAWSVLEKIRPGLGMKTSTPKTQHLCWTHLSVHFPKQKERRHEITPLIVTIYVHPSLFLSKKLVQVKWKKKKKKIHSMGISQKHLNQWTGVMGQEVHGRMHYHCMGIWALLWKLWSESINKKC